MNGRILCGVVATLMCSVALAQQAAPSGAKPAAGKEISGLEEIVVTANRREQNIQDVGTSIAAFTGDAIKEQGVISAADITAITPNIDVVRSYSGPGFNTQIAIRGVGQPDFSDETEATATTYVDEFYMIGAGQADFLTFDLARVEVARGPQGTVQGRNSTAGSLNYYTNAPVLNKTSGEASLSLGDYHLARTNGFLNLPVGDTVAFRASFATDTNQGYIKNINPSARFAKGGNSDFFGGRVQMLYQPSADFKLLVKAEYGQSGPIVSNEQAYETGTLPGQVGTYPAATDAFGQSAAALGEGSPGTVNTPYGNQQNASIRHALVRADWKLSGGWSAVGLAGYLRSNKDDIETCDHTPLPICLFSNQAESRHSTAEFRTNYDSAGFRATIGANYLKHDIDSRSATPLFFSAAITPFRDAGGKPTGLYTQTFRDQQTLKSYAVFGQTEWDFANKWTLITGARFTHDNKEFDGFDAVSISLPVSTPIPYTVDQFLALGALAAANPTGGVTLLNASSGAGLNVFSKGMVNLNVQLNYKASADTLYYGSYRRGVKGGGFIAGNAAGTPANLRKYQDEQNNALEFGIKTTMRDIRTRVNASVFYYDYKNMQNLTLIGITNVIANKDSKLYGGEVELTSGVTESFDLSAGVGFVKTDVPGIYNPTGAVAAFVDNELPLAPKLSANAQARYKWGTASGAQMYFQLAGKYKGGFWRDSLNNLSTRMPSSNSIDALLNYTPEGDRWHVSFWVNNILDNRPAINKFDLSAVGGTGEIVYQAPRWYGATLTAKF